MNKVTKIDSEVIKPVVTRLELGDIYERVENKEYYIVCVDLENGYSNSLFCLSSGCRWTKQENCLKNINNGEFVKVPKGTILQIEVQ